MSEILFPHNPFWETKTFHVGQDWEVPIEGFFIIGAKDETKRSIIDFTNKEATELIGVIRSVRFAMQKLLGIKEVYIFQNEDTDHGFHVWLFPRHDWMDPIGRKIQSVRPIMEFAITNSSSPIGIRVVNNAVEKMKKHFTKS